MAAFDPTPGVTIEDMNDLSKLATSYKATTLAKSDVAFGSGGAATGNDVIGLWNQSIKYSESIDAIVARYTSPELHTSWLHVMDDNVPAIRQNLIDGGVQIALMLTMLEDNEAAYITATMDRPSVSLVYPALTAQQRADVKVEIDLVSALII